MKYWYFSITLALSFAADQLTKMWARRVLKPIYPGAIHVFNGFDFRYAENDGSAFSLLRGPWTPYVLFVFGLVALGVLVHYLRKADRPITGALFGLIAGGAAGNLLDRISFGHVTDFVVWSVSNHAWPTFNVADAALVVGILLTLFATRGADRRRAAAT
jgi:signal peptidase II